jgi:hypothetical protein
MNVAPRTVVSGVSAVSTIGGGTAGGGVSGSAADDDALAAGGATTGVEAGAAPHATRNARLPRRGDRMGRR